MSRDASFTPKSLSASEYIRALFEPADNIAILVRHRESGRTMQRIARADRVAGSEFQQWLASAAGRGSDIYVGMNPLREGAHNRTKNSIDHIRHVYLDLDRDGDESLRVIREATSVPPPNFVLHTSPGNHQVVWKVSGFTREQAESLLRRLAENFGGDPAATDSTRTLRLPGFVNQKRSNSFVVRAQQESESIYSPRDFTIRHDSPEVPRPFGARAQGQHAAPSHNHRSQSERDWAYARRALARGEDPETVIELIAQFRAGEKSDPHYYARLTLTKAQSGLAIGGTTNRAARADSEQGRSKGYVMTNRSARHRNRTD